MNPLRAGDKAPPFTLAGIDGAAYSLAGSGSVPSLLAFFKNTCPTCVLTFPFLQRLYERVQDAPLHFLGISQDSAAQTRVFADQHGITFPLLPDGAAYPVSNEYGLTSVPTMFLVEPDGTLSWTSVGFSRADLEGLAAGFHGRFRIPGVTPLFVEADDAPAMRPG